jgi:hypothetical protein
MHGEQEPDTTACAGRVTQRSLVVTMDRGRWLRTQWTTRCGSSRSDLDHQAVFGDLDLFNLHSFWQSKQGSPLPSQPRFMRENYLLLIIMDKIYHHMSIYIFTQGKRGLSPQSGQEPIYLWRTEIALVLASKE